MRSRSDIDITVRLKRCDDARPPGGELGATPRMNMADHGPRTEHCHRWTVALARVDLQLPGMIGFVHTFGRTLCGSF